MREILEIATLARVLYLSVSEFFFFVFLILFGSSCLIFILLKLLLLQVIPELYKIDLYQKINGTIWFIDIPIFALCKSSCVGI